MILETMKETMESELKMKINEMKTKILIYSRKNNKNKVKRRQDYRTSK